ncbi:MAG: glucuronate isomerase, partial [Pseudomonadota bacterium]
MLYNSIRSHPIVSPHGHTNPAWFALNTPFPDPARLLIVPDHYVLRMLISQGVAPEALGIPRRDGGAVETDGRAIWRRFASHYPLFQGTPTRLWLDFTFEHLFGLTTRPSAATADESYDRIAWCLEQDTHLPRALFTLFGIEVLATTEGPLDDLFHHRAIAADAWPGRVITTYRPDAVTDPETPDFAANLQRFGEVTGTDTGAWSGYLEAHRKRRAVFRDHGATATDHGPPTADTADLTPAEAAALFDRVRHGATGRDAALFRAQMLTEMARMSVEDGMVMQLHPGAVRNHHGGIFSAFGPDRGFDMPARTDYVRALAPLLNAVGMERD